MAIVRVHRDDYGISFVYTVTNEDGTAQNISDASSVSLKIGRYDGITAITKAMSFYSDGSDGKVQCSFADGDLDTAKYYDAEIHVNYSSGRLASKQFTLHVLPDL